MEEHLTAYDTMRALLHQARHTGTPERTLGMLLTTMQYLLDHLQDVEERLLNVERQQAQDAS